MGGKCSTGESNTEPIWEIDGETIDLPRAHNDGVEWVAASQSGTCFSAGHDRNLVLYNWAFGLSKQSWPKPHLKEMTRVAACKNKPVFVSVSADGSIKTWRLGKSEPACDVQGHGDMITAVDIGGGNSKCVTGGKDMFIKIWDLGSGKRLRETDLVQSIATDVRMTANGRTLVHTAQDKEVRIWDARTLKIVRKMPLDTSYQQCCDVSADGRQALTGCSGFGGGFEAMLWDIGEGRLINSYYGHTRKINGCKFLQDRSGSGMKLFVTVSEDNSVRMWSSESKDCLASYAIKMPFTSVATYSGSTRFVASSQQGNHVFAVRQGGGEKEFQLQELARF